VNEIVIFLSCLFLIQYPLLFKQAFQNFPANKQGKINAKKTKSFFAALEIKKFYQEKRTGNYTYECRWRNVTV